MPDLSAVSGRGGDFLSTPLWKEKIRTGATLKVSAHAPPVHERINVKLATKGVIQVLGAPQRFALEPRIVVVRLNRAAKTALDEPEGTRAEARHRLKTRSF